MKTILVTGASTGLGLAIARLLLDKPYRLLLTAREESLPRFEEAGIHESDRVMFRPLNVRLPEEREAVVEEANQSWGGVDILINNAGIAYRSVVEHVHEEERTAQMEINFQGPMELARLVLPSMRAKREGRIINVSSVGGMMAMPTMAVYSASKFALEGATEALYYEVKPWNIKVSLVQPGFIRSTSFEKTQYTRMSAHAAQKEDDPYYNHYHFMGPFIARLMNSSPATPERVAAKIYRVMTCRHPALRVSATPDATLFYLLRRVLPRGLYHWVLYRNLPHVRSWGEDQKEA